MISSGFGEAFGMILVPNIDPPDAKTHINVSSTTRIAARLREIILGTSLIDPAEFGARSVVPEVIYRLPSKIR